MRITRQFGSLRKLIQSNPFNFAKAVVNPYEPFPPKPTPPVPPLPPVFPPKFVGINLGGFDAGNAVTIQEATYSCISDQQMEWIKASGVNIVRCPIIPAYIFKEPPTEFTEYSADLFSAIWTDGMGDEVNPCGDNDNVWNVSTYMSAIKFLVNNKMNVIIDAHENLHHLCTFGGQESMTPGVFQTMWKLIATYIIENVPDDKYVWFELFNEPVAGENCQEISPTDWNNNYVIPTIQAIREVEGIFVKHHILVTTWGNYSGLHLWVEDGTLQGLVDALVQNGYEDTEKSKILIAGHQYCDSNYSGTGQGCDAQTFNANLYNQWINQTSQILTPAKLKWFMSEGNVNCGYETNCNEMNGNLFIEFLNTVVLSEACSGFSVWLSNLGDNYQGQNMGGGPQTQPNLFDAYKVIYPYSGNVYNFSAFFPLYT